MIFLHDTQFVHFIHHCYSTIQRLVHIRIGIVPKIILVLNERLHICINSLPYAQHTIRTIHSKRVMNACRAAGNTTQHIKYILYTYVYFVIVTTSTRCAHRAQRAREMRSRLANNRTVFARKAPVR